MLLTAWISDNVLQAICRTFLHSLWQGLFAALLAGLVLLLTKRSGASLRYNLLGALLLLFLAGTGITFWFGLTAFPDAIPATAITSARALSGAPSPGLLTLSLQFIDAHAAQIMLIWGLVFLLKCMRMGAGFYHIFRTRRSNTAQPPVEWVEKLRQLALSLGVRTPVRLLECARIQMPFTIGWLKPCIYIPAGLLARLPADQLEAILLHELAHIRRRDYLVNILQRFAETVFFFNPALLWISARIREEREACCDDIAMAHTPRQSSYLHALVAFEHDGQPLQLGMTLGRKRFFLLERIKRLLTNENKKLTLMEKGILLLGLAGIAAFGFIPAGEQPAAPQIQTQPAKDTTVKPFKTVKLKKDTTKRLKLVPVKTDTVKVYKVKRKDSVRVISFETDKHSKRQPKNTYYFTPAKDSVYVIKKKRPADTAVFFVSNPSIKKVRSYEVYKDSLGRRRIRPKDGAYKEIKVYVDTVRKHVKPSGAGVTYVSPAVDPRRVKPVLKKVIEVRPVENSAPAIYLNEPKNVKPAKDKPKPAAKPDKKEASKQKANWHAPKYYKPTFQEKAAQSLPAPLQQHLVPPVGDC